MTPDQLDRQDFNDPDFATIIGLYVLDEITLGKAAEQAGKTRWEMEEFLRDNGVEVHYGPREKVEVQEEIETALKFRK